MNKLKRLNIELSAHCSYQCVGCPNTFMKRKKGHMSFDLFNKIFSEIDDKVKNVYLWNYGEPLLNPDIDKILLRVKNSLTHVSLSTTGMNLNIIDNIECLQNVDELIISINGLDKETYEFHQKGGNFDNVIDGLKRIKPIMESSNVDYILQVVANVKNILQIDELNDFAKKYSFKTIVIKSFNCMDNNNKTLKKFVPLGTKFSRYKIDSSIKKISERNEPCLSSFVINWNGDVNPCCWDYKGEFILGNVSQDRVFGVWNSNDFQKHLNKIMNKKYFPFCNSVNCKTNTTILKWRVNYE